MKLQLIVAAFALWSGIKFSDNAKSHHFNSVETECVHLESQQIRMTGETLRILLEDYAAPHWNLSKNQAWIDYYDNVIVLQEVEPDAHYVIQRTGLELDVILEME